MKRGIIFLKTNFVLNNHFSLESQYKIIKIILSYNPVLQNSMFYIERSENKNRNSYFE